MYEGAKTKSINQTQPISQILAFLQLCRQTPFITYFWFDYSKILDLSSWNYNKGVGFLSLC